MPAWIARHAVPAAWRRIPWKMVWAVALWLGAKGRDRIESNLTQKEQHEFWRLVKKSKGRPSSLPQRDRMRLKNIAGKAIRGS
ncbi:MAG TPA: hypothetical protein VNP96_02275 [Solirubrobacterales bacterium]|nr:hypothetical protein [Solirubrobacterales bacterium]